MFNNVITAVPMHLCRFFQLKTGEFLRGAKKPIPYIPYQSLLLSTTVLNDMILAIDITDGQGLSNEAHCE